MAGIHQCDAALYGAGLLERFDPPPAGIARKIYRNTDVIDRQGGVSLQDAQDSAIYLV